MYYSRTIHAFWPLSLVRRLLLDLADCGPLLFLRDIHSEHIPALGRVARAAKQNINLLERHLLRFGDEEVDVGPEDDVHAHEEEEALEARAGEELGEELLEDGVGDVLHLGAHADGLGADVHAEDLGRPHPDGGAPGRFVEEGEEEEEEDDGGAHGLRLGVAVTVGGRGEADDGDDEHAGCHADGADDEQPATAVAVRGPHGVEGEEDAKRGVERIDEVDGLGARPDVAVDGRGIAVERALPGELLTDVEETGEEDALPYRGVTEQGGVAGAPDGLLLVLDGAANG